MASGIGYRWLSWFFIPVVPRVCQTAKNALEGFVKMLIFMDFTVRSGLHCK